MLIPALAAVILAPLVAAKGCPNSLKTSYTAPVPADGWTARVVTNQGLSKPRSLLFDDKGALLILDASVGVRRFVLEDHGGSCITVKESSLIVDNKDLNHGLQLSPDGKTLYVSSANEVLAYSYDASSGSISGDPKVIVTGMANAMHQTRTIFYTSGGDLLVSRGSAANADVLARDESTGHCQIRSFSVSRQGTDYMKGDLVGWGLRNSVGIGEHPKSRGIFSVENSVDNLSRQGTDIHNSNPGEELNYHGTVGNYTRANFGYPMCYTVWDTNGFPNLGSLKTGDNFAVEVAEDQNVASGEEPNGVIIQPISDEECNAKFSSPALALPAHTAPLDIKFDKDGKNAYVSLHGSWNADPPVGYALVQVPFNDNGQPEGAKDAKNGYKEILKSPDLSKCPRGCFRPVGLAWDSKDRLFLASDSTQEIFVVMQGKDAEGESAAVAARPSAAVLAVAVGVVAALFL